MLKLIPCSNSVIQEMFMKRQFSGDSPNTRAMTTSVTTGAVRLEHSRCNSSFSSFSLWANSSIFKFKSLLSATKLRNLQCTLATPLLCDSCICDVSLTCRRALGRLSVISYLWPICRNPRWAVIFPSLGPFITISLSFPKVSASSPKWTLWCSGTCKCYYFLQCYIGK